VRYRPSTPIIFLTATASKTVLTDLEDLTSLLFDRTDLLWSASPSSVAWRQVYIDVEPRESPLAPLKADIRSRYFRPPTQGGSGALPKDKLIFTPIPGSVCCATRNWFLHFSMRRRIALIWSLCMVNCFMNKSSTTSTLSVWIMTCLPLILLMGKRFCLNRRYSFQLLVLPVPDLTMWTSVSQH
jgi:hypothetical protein